MLNTAVHNLSWDCMLFDLCVLSWRDSTFSSVFVVLRSGVLASSVFSLRRALLCFSGSRSCSTCVIFQYTRCENDLRRALTFFGSEFHNVLRMTVSFSSPPNILTWALRLCPSHSLKSLIPCKFWAAIKGHYCSEFLREYFALSPLGAGGWYILSTASWCLHCSLRR